MCTHAPSLLLTYPNVQTKLNQHLLSHYYNIVCNVITINPNSRTQNSFKLVIWDQTHRNNNAMHALFNFAAVHKQLLNPESCLQKCMKHHQQQISLLIDESFDKALKQQANIPNGIVARLILQYKLSVIKNHTSDELVGYKKKHLQAMYFKLHLTNFLHCFAAGYLGLHSLGLLMTSLFNKIIMSKKKFHLERNLMAVSQH